jgi:hypothetical protein
MSSQSSFKFILVQRDQNVTRHVGALIINPKGGFPHTLQQATDAVENANHTLLARWMLCRTSLQLCWFGIVDAHHARNGYFHLL